MVDEKRRFSRIVFNVRAKLSTSSNEYYVDRIVNLSVGGCLLEIFDNLPSGIECSVTILLDRMAPGVEIFGRVVRVNAEGVGIQFTRIDPENLFHLQNIIKYNAEDPDKIEQEIDSHPGLI